ncbi:putative dna repair and recombination protein rhm52 protein [Phaeoacremonium minimum UCRPA7]|uniref:RAD52 homolog n=1 Tax=Phaeoacremonium minimum (strain UCR-PA7) TaxID=1286976 RepID=R8BTF8_PHAM7|nr:putative dna repair and recombination protein rhm52 protein [Phaeoacremonium minimum UCRPA7]EOO02594.1 putative dna repair and recombination protein rhm52 protein [Phaeoacremonium minimum UCRPA7]
MPAPGDQHNTIVNPFEEAKPRMSEFTAQEIATLQSRLEKQLGPEYLSARTGPSGQKVHYIAAEKCIALANEVFGFNGWSSSIQNIQVDFVDENPQTLKISLGLSVIVRVTLRDGTFHEDIGYGHIENCKGKAAAFEKAKKEGTTDALKRALRNFGNVLGNCIYDKAYLQKVTKMKVEPSKFHESELHRHADFVKKEVKEEVVKVDSSTSAATSMTVVSGEDSFEDLLGEFDEVDFCVTEDGHPDEFLLPAANDKAQQTNPQNAQANGQSGTAGGETTGFFSARAVSILSSQKPDAEPALPQAPQVGQVFNPHAESPSIRKTPGIDHTTSKPLARTGQHVAPAKPSETGSNGTSGPPVPANAAAAKGLSPAVPPVRGNVLNPSLDHARRIGAPGGPGSPLANRGQYRPPTIKRPLDTANATGRPALAEVPTNGPVGAGGNVVAGDVKRQKMA